MMEVDFNALVDRTPFHTIKYEFVENHFHGEKPVFTGSNEENSSEADLQYWKHPISGTIPLWVADQDLPTCPEIQKAIQDRACHPTFGYTWQPRRMWELISQWLDKTADWKVEVEEFIFSPSTLTAFANVLSVFSRKGDGVVLFTPLYAPLQSAVRARGRELICIPMLMKDNVYSMDFDALETVLQEQKVRMVLLCNPQNPSGRVWTVEELQQLLDLCNKHNVLVVSDEVHGDLVLWHHKHTPAAKLCRSVITLRAPSKTWNLAGLHASFVIIQEAGMRERYLSYVSASHQHFGSVFATAAMEAAYEFGGPHLLRLKTHLEENIKYLEEFLSTHLPSINPMRPQATFLVWLDFSKLEKQLKLNSKELGNFLLQDCKVLFNPGSEYAENCASFRRINVACPRLFLSAALKRIHEKVSERLLH